MNKTAIKNFAVWARRKLIDDVTLKARSLGITAEGIATKNEEKSTNEVHFFNIGTGEDVGFSGTILNQRTSLVRHMENKACTTSHETAFHSVIEEVAYTWFNRMIAIRFMEVNGYLPSGVRVLSSDMAGKKEPDMVTRPFETDLEFSTEEREKVGEMLDEGDSDPLFSLLFVKQCNALNSVLPRLFEETHDYTELLLNVSYIKEDGVISRLVSDISEDDFKNQVEIVGWLYQYYNTEPKEKVFADLKKNIKITKENIPAATQLFTPDWIVKYMVENSLGRLWLEQNKNAELRELWKYYLDEAEQSPAVTEKLVELRENHPVNLEEIKFLDPCMGSAHILVYAFDVFMDIYKSQGYKPRKAVESIVKNNLYGLDIDKRAYQLAYFAIMMKAIQYDDRFLGRNISPMVYSPVKDEELVNVGSLYKIIELPPEPKGEDFDPLDLLVKSLEEHEQNWQFKCVLCGKYDVVCTNPPYMGGSNGNKELVDFMKKEFPDSKGDLFAVFMEKCFDFVKETGLVAMITQHSFMFLSTYEKLRGKLLNKEFVNMAHLGARAFEEIGGEVVQTTTFVMRNEKIEDYQSVFVRLVDFKSQKEKELEFLSGNHHHTAQQENFSKIPGSPIAYWVSESMLEIFVIGVPLGELAISRNGMKTGDNKRFIRLWTEIMFTNFCTSANTFHGAVNSGLKWFPYNKGGEYRKWYGNNDFVVNWENSGYEIFNGAEQDKRNVQNYPDTLKFSSSGSWGLISSAQPSFRFRENNLSDIAGMSFYTDRENVLQLLGFCNSPIAKEILELLAPTINYQAGDIGRLPMIISEPHKPAIDNLVEQNISLSKIDWDSFETSWDFKKHPLLQGNRVQSAYNQWEADCQIRFDTLKSNEEELNRLFIEIYGLQEELTPEVEDKDVTVRLADLQREVKSFISYGIGCLFGRYSLDCEGLAYAGGDWDSDKYQTLQPVVKNCLVICHEDYQGRDLTALFVDFLKIAYGEDTLSENIDFIVKALGTKGDSPEECLTSYFMKDFYKDHLKIYQKRPIYWLYDSGKENGFKALMYIHRYNQDSTGQTRTDFLHPLQTVYQEMLKSLEFRMQEGGSSGKLTKEKEKLTKKLEETRKYDEKLSHLANIRIALELDDGVKVNYEKLQTGSDGKKIDILGKI